LCTQAGGGHAAYALSRQLRLFEKDTYAYDGGLNERVIAAIATGSMRELSLEGSCGLSKHFNQLLEAFKQPTCSVRSLALQRCDWPQGKSVSDLLVPVSALGTRLWAISLRDMAVGGELLSVFFEKCTQLRRMHFTKLGLDGSLPGAIGNLTKIDDILLHTNLMSGPCEH
jgi:hypothetical protein